MKIHFVRHGESLANTLHIISNHDLDHSLTEKGRAQVMRVSASLKDRPIERIYTTPTIGRAGCKAWSAINVPQAGRRITTSSAGSCLLSRG